MSFLKNLLRKDEPQKSAPKKEAAGLKMKDTPIASVKAGAPATLINAGAGVGILVAPHMTEKTVAGNQAGNYTFRIRRGANKIAVRHAVEARYGVHVKDVRIVKAKSKVRRMGRREGILPGFTKAVVQLAKGEGIELGA
jgi:large subunit ribosomal protein L23